MDLHEIVAPTMKELFIKEIEGKIISGEWKPGDKLPTEREMEKITRVSRTIINSALSEMAQKGFVEIVPRKGVFVGDYTKHGQLDTLLAIINFNGGKLDKKTFRSLAEYRLLFDSECCALAAEHRTEKDLENLKNIYTKMTSATEMEELLNLKFEFLHGIYYATGNNIYPLVCNSFKQVCYTFNKVIFTHFGFNVNELHIMELINSIEKRDSEESRKIMNNYLTHKISEVSQVYFKD